MQIQLEDTEDKWKAVAMLLKVNESSVAILNAEKPNFEGYSIAVVSRPGFFFINPYSLNSLSPT